MTSLAGNYGFMISLVHISALVGAGSEEHICKAGQWVIPPVDSWDVEVSIKLK